MYNNNNKEKLYDTVLEVAMTNFYTLSKNSNGKIILKNFDRKNKGHLCLIKVADLASIFGIKTYIKTNFLNCFLIKLITKNKTIKTNYSKENLVDCNEFINYIEEAYQSRGIFKEIWEVYFSKKGKSE